MTMPRRYVFSVAELQGRRARAWAEHYESRQIGKELASGLDVKRVLRVLQESMPLPELDVDGYLFESRQMIHGMNKALDILHWSFLQRRLMCVWYWSESGWMDFVHLYQSLPELYERHYLVYDAEADAGRLIPMSSKPKQGSLSRMAVDNPVDNFSTSRRQKVQVGSTSGSLQVE